MEKRVFFSLFVLIFLIANLVTLYAAEIYVNPITTTLEAGQSVLIEVRGKVPAGGTDVYAIQFDVDYDPAILSFNSITEGTLLNGDGVSTVFGHGLVNGGKINNVYGSRNTTTGVYNNDSVLAIISFSAIGAGTSYVNLNEVIWVNSTITNSTVKIPFFIINNGSIIVTGSGSIPSSSSGGGGGGSGGTGITQNNSVVNGSVSSISNSSINNETLANETSSNDSGFLPFTGRVIDNVFGEGSIFKSWIFYFILGLILIFVTVIIIRKKYKTKMENTNNY